MDGYQKAILGSASQRLFIGEGGRGERLCQVPPPAMPAIKYLVMLCVLSISSLV